MPNDINSLFSAIAKGKLRSIRKILDSQIDVNEKNDDGETALHYAVGINGRFVAKLFTEYEPESPFPIDTPEIKNIDIVKLLLEYGADPNIFSNDDETPLHSAVKEDYIDIAELLLSYGADINAIWETGYYGTPLHHAVSKEMASFLLDNGALVDADEWHGDTCLHDAVHHNQPDVCRVLIDYGADIDARNHSGWSPLHWAIWKDNADIVELLLSKGVSANSRVKGRCTTGWTSKNWEAPEPLKDIADVRLRNCWTPLHLAAIKNNTQIMEKLINHGAKVNLTITKNGTPLHWAELLGNKEAVELLKRHGAK